MEKINLIIADADEEYINYFTSFVRNSELNRTIVIQSCTKFEKLKVCLRDRKEKVILLLSSDWISDIDKKEQIHVLVTLAESNVGTEEVDNLTLFKYQPLNELLSKLMTFYYDEQKISKIGHENTSIVSFYSTIGGAGKTTAAINLAKQLSLFNEKVLYLNLEAISSVELFLQISETDEFARLLYYAKSKPDGLHMELQKLVRYDSTLKIDYIHPLQNVKDIEDIEMEDIQTIIQSLVDHQKYNVIIIDLDSSLHPRVWAAMEASRHIIWLLSDDIQCRLKTKKIWKELISLYDMDSEQFKLKNHFIINKYTGAVMNDFETNEIQMSSFLPYIPQWKSVHEGQQLFSSDMFNRSMLKLYRTIENTDEANRYG